MATAAAPAALRIEPSIQVCSMLSPLTSAVAAAVSPDRGSGGYPTWLAAENRRAFPQHAQTGYHQCVYFDVMACAKHSRCVAEQQYGPVVHQTNF